MLFQRMKTFNDAIKAIYDVMKNYSTTDFCFNFLLEDSIKI